MQLGMIGLGRMGGNMAKRIAAAGHEVVGYDHSPESDRTVASLKELVAALKAPRLVWVMVPAGEATDSTINELAELLQPGDMIIDGGNSRYTDDARHAAELEPKGIHFMDCGVSGGVWGIDRGYALMVGGSQGDFESARPIFEALKPEGDSGLVLAGPVGGGHFAKMVHNGIEYADMQLIAESYLLLKYIGGFSNDALAGLFSEWNKGELKSFLIGITADIFREADDLADGSLVDHILDSAAQKGTGRWTSIESLRQGVDISTITAAAGARVMSNALEIRKQARDLIEPPALQRIPDRAAFAEQVRQALYTAKIIAYAQGFSLMRDASERYGWALDLGSIAAIFRAGCIIQADFLNDITAAFRRDPALSSLLLDEFFRSRLAAGHNSLRACAAAGLQSGLPLPAMTNALSYLDQFRGQHVGANLIQAQRDLFGAHTYERTDRPGVFHHEWRRNS